MPSEFKHFVIADTSCFILRDKIDGLSLLRELFGTVTTTPTIAKEFGKILPGWVDVKSPSNQNYLKLLESEVDKGEASAIALALENTSTLLILDDWKARTLAKKLDLNFTGTLGIFLKAKEVGLVKKIKPSILRIQNTNFRFSKDTVEAILKAAQES
jgi:predicted nucleic acid-binding protein